MTGVPADRVRVLLVEDEFLVALMMEDLLAELGCAVVGPVGQLSEAVRLAGTETVRGAVLDVNLGGDRVFPVAEILKDRGIPFVFLTGYGASATVGRFDAPVLTKPVDAAAFARTVRDTIIAPSGPVGN